MADGTPDRCTVSTDNVKLCGQDGIPDAPIPICFEHAAALLSFMQQRIEDAVGDGTDFRQMRVMAVMADGYARRARTSTEARQANAVVYYVRVGDMVKIGTTTNLTARLNAYPPGSRLLACESGGIELERQRLGQFADALMSGNEWFTPTKRLMAHIDAIRDGGTVSTFTGRLLA